MEGTAKARGYSFQASISATLDLTEAPGRKVEFDYQDAFVITLVLLVHAALAWGDENHPEPVRIFQPIFVPWLNRPG